MKFKIIFILFLLLVGVQNVEAQKVKLIVDADTGNEMDDMYAITRVFDTQDAELLGLISAQFNNPQLITDSMWYCYPTKNINTVQISQMENERLLQDCKRLQIPHPSGSEKMVGFPWGFNHHMSVARSAGVDFIISEAKKASPENKLTVACLGPATDVAAAILTEPDIARNIQLYLLSMRYDPATGIWNKNEFNARNDLNALDIVLNCSDLELVVISAQVSGQLIFNREDTQNRLAAYPAEISKYLSARWDVVHAGKNWIMWDLALIEAILHPELATLEESTTPPENTRRSIHVFTHIDVEKMKADFWKSYKRLMQENLH